jgi:Carboxypeptidase regulatory-like domain
MVAITAHCVACTIAYTNVPVVGPDFRVRVEDRGRPVEGLRLKITGGQAVTDKNGIASFRGVPSGSNLVSADLDTGIAGVALDVKPDGPTDLVVPMKWPNVAPAVVRSLQGTIRGPDYLHRMSQPQLSLDLLDAISGKLLKSLQTTDSGEFNFESDAPGLYFLRLNPSGLRGGSGEEITGLIAVAVDHFPPTDHLDLDFGWTSCGLWYSDASRCPQDDLQIGELSGHVVDSSGAAIGDASVVLIDPAGEFVERLKSDRTGAFASAHLAAGTYQLVVSRAGFTPLRRIVH